MRVLDCLIMEFLQRLMGVYHTNCIRLGDVLANEHGIPLPCV